MQHADRVRSKESNFMSKMMPARLADVTNGTGDSYKVNFGSGRHAFSNTKVSHFCA